MRVSARFRSWVLASAALLIVAVVVWVFSGSQARTEPAPERGRHTALKTSTLPRGSAAVSPLFFARSTVAALFGYDTRGQRGPWRRALLSELGSTPGSGAEKDVDRLIPDVQMWEQMAAVHQHSTALLEFAYIPALWTQTVREHPELPIGAVGVTVTGTQLVSWDGGSAGIPLAVTVLLLCPPAAAQCVLNRITAQVAR